VLIARAFGVSVAADGFSWPYRYAMALSTCLYGFLGVWLAFSLAKRYFSPGVAFAATIVVWCASSLPVYMYFNPSWSHAHSAFMCALFLWFWDATRDSRSLIGWVLLGFIVGLMLDVYYANLMIAVVLLVEVIQQYAQLFKRHHSVSPNLGQLLGRHLLFGLVVIVTMTPTFVSRWIIYGGPFKTGYLSLRDFLWTTPVFFSVLFSANHGLLSWTPVLALSILGLFLFAMRAPRAGIPYLAAFVTFYLFISFYPDWAGISSFGNRFFISVTPLFVLGLACVLEQCKVLFSRSRVALPAIAGVLACFVIWNIGLIYQWGAHLIPARGPISFREATYNQFFVVPQKISGQLRTYIFHRRQLMQQIEQKDIEQLKQRTEP